MVSLTRYLARAIVGPLLLAVTALALLTWALQTMRLSHLLLGSNAPAGELAGLLVYSLPTLLLFVTPLALVAAMLLVRMRLHGTGQLQAMRAAGASPLQLARGPLALVLLCLVLCAAGGGWLQGPALARLQRTVVALAARVAVERIEPGLFHQLEPGTVVHASATGRTAGGDVRLHRVFLHSEAPQQLITAREATVRLSHLSSDALAGAPALELRDGEVHLRGDEGSHVRVRFQTLRQPLPIARHVSRHFGFIQRGAPMRVWQQSAACVGFGLVALAALLLPLSNRAAVGLAIAGAGVAAGAAWLLDSVWVAPQGSLLINGLVAALGLGALWWVGGRGAGQWVRDGR